MMRLQKLAATAVMIGGLMALISMGTLAILTDQAVVGANTFTTGTIDLGTSPTTALATYAGMMPGDTVTEDIVITNVAGSNALRYSVTSTATNTDGLGLKDQLVFTVKTIDIVTPLTPCDDFDGTELYSGDLDSSAGKIIGDAAGGFHTGDRPLASAASETLCFRFTLPLDTSSAFDLSTTTATFTFDAEQSVNN